MLRSNPKSCYRISSLKRVTLYITGKPAFEKVDVNQKTISRATGTCVSEKLLYQNKCEIGYPLSDGTKIAEKG